MNRKHGRRASVAGLCVLAAAALYVTGCVRWSEGTWYVKSAELPEGWPTLTPVGEVRIKEYPLYRAATVREADLEREGVGPMFNELFGHISDRRIAMTAPVDMGFGVTEAGETRMASMAFLYRRPTQGELERDGGVVVEDLPARTYASVGVRGGYTNARFARNLTVVVAWLDEHAEVWAVDGDPRYLGYNGPFTLPFMRYGEVQVPVRRRGD